ncbi:Aldo/keto reductase [Macleaya cordata]|uniref:Aldo/keto reductase n=1 Tax=Macleaya cordata TaxID=56857 RepID=A0A200QF94_MACCD|nr:Aldo/keto reductase [Macleaya cordata]
MGEEISSSSVLVVPVATLSSGRTMPLLGMGTAAYPLVGSEGVKSAILHAIKLGYRHFDTAALYFTEECLGEAVAEALQLGLLKSRDELFITSKLWCSDSHPHRVLPALQTSLRKLKLEYLDLYLIHWPLSIKPDNYDFPPPKEELLPMDFKSVWVAMEECQKLGLTKSIGVSNFSCKKLQDLMATAKIPPAVNQVEMNPIWQQRKLREFCKANGILITAYSPLGANGTPWGSSGVVETQVLHDIAKARGKTHAQVCLRWVYEQGVSLLVKSYNEERMKENLTVFDWELSEEDSKKISTEIPQRRGLPGDIFVSVNGPFKEKGAGEMENAVIIPVMSLSSGREVPVLGMGTAEILIGGSERVKLALLNAIKVGYRHFDTAAVYQSEESLGEAVAEALQLGLLKSRDQLFITSKLWCSDSHPHRVLPALQNSLRKLKLEYLDLYLIHWPLSSTPGKLVFPVPKEDLLPLDFQSVWAAMEECQKLGLTKSIGVSNFSCKKLQDLLATANIPPAVNQVEMNPLWQQKKLREFCKANGILITAYSPLGAKGTPWGSSGVMDSEVLHHIAKSRGKSIAQISLRWVYEQGVSVLVKSFNEERMKENLKIFDWELSAEDLKRISEIPQRRGLPSDVFVSVNGPFKSEEELWNGERERAEMESITALVIPVKTLSSGREMPVLGMGTAENLIEGSEKVKLALLTAIKVGYRHFDTAAIYQTEESLGEAIAEALQLGLLKSRDQLFITSKLWCSDAHPDRVLPALQTSLRKLKLEYLDLYLIHWPISSKPVEKHEYPVPKESLLSMDFQSVWAAMEECQKLGLTKSIGVSNFSCKKLQDLLANANIPPAVNQVEMNPPCQQKKLREFCKANGILVTAFSPLGAKGTSWGSSRVMDTEVLHQIALVRGKSIAQVSLRWVYEQGVSLLVKSFNEERMKENLKIFDWELSAEDLKKIGEIPHRRGHSGDGFVSVNGPFKSEEELWDGEL